jgi:hypothetical protein
MADLSISLSQVGINGLMSPELTSGVNLVNSAEKTLLALRLPRKIRRDTEP